MADAVLAYQREAASSIFSSCLALLIRLECNRYVESQGISCYVYGRLPSSASPIVYGGGRISAKPQRKSSEVGKASEFSTTAETVNKSIDPSLSGHEKIVELIGGSARAHKTHRSLRCTKKEDLDEHHGIDWHTRSIKRIHEGLPYLHHRQLEHRICHVDIKPDNILLDANMLAKIADFGLSRCFGENIVGTNKTVEYNGNLAAHLSVEHHRLDWNTRLKTVVAICGALAYRHDEERRTRACHLDLKPENILLDEQLARNMRNCIGTQGYKAPEMKGNIISDVCIFSLIIMSTLAAYFVDNKATAEEILQEYWRNKQQATQIMWMLQSSSKQMKRLNQIVLSCLETGKSTKVTRSTVSSTQRAVHDIIVSDSGVRISATVDVPKMKPSPACINMDKAPTAEDSGAHVLDSGSSTLAPAPSMHRHLSHSNLTDERSNKPLSNRAPATISSDNTTRSPMEPNKLTHDQAHSDPNSSVDERNTNAEATRSGKWYVATGAAHHATGDRGLITNLVEELEHDSLCVHAADGTPMPVRGRGNVETDNVVLPDVYYVPGLWTNLVSVGQLAGLDYCVGFSRGACHISDAAGVVVGTAHARGDGLYEVDHLRVPLGML